MRAFTAVFLFAAMGSLLGCTEEAPPPKMPAKVYVPWLVKKKPTPKPSAPVVTTAPASEPSPDAPESNDEPGEAEKP